MSYSQAKFYHRSGKTEEAVRISDDGHCKYIDAILLMLSIDVSQQGHKAEIHV